MITALGGWTVETGKYKCRPWGTQKSPWCIVERIWRHSASIHNATTLETTSSKVWRNYRPSAQPSHLLMHHKTLRNIKLRERKKMWINEWNHSTDDIRRTLFEKFEMRNFSLPPHNMSTFNGHQGLPPVQSVWCLPGTINWCLVKQVRLK